MKRTTTVLLTLTLVLSLVSIAAIAQPFDGGGARGERGFRSSPMIRGLMKLDLTDDQRDQIRTLLEERRETMKDVAEAAREEMQSIREELRSLMEADVYDEAAATQLLARKSEIENYRRIEREKIRHYILNQILTEEQRDILAEQRANARAFGRDRKAGPAGRRF